jgi:serine phosphatase RsbU (regulator of sigma subunit)
MQLYTTIINIGALPKDSLRLTKKINLINSFCFLTIVSTFLFLFHLFFIKDYNYLPIQLGVTIALLGSFVFSKYRNFQGAFYWVFIISVINLFFRSIEAPNSGVEFFLIPAALVVVLIMENRNKGIPLILLALVAFWLSYYLKDNYQPSHIISTYYTQITFIIILNVVFLICVLLLYQFKILNSNYEQIIATQAKHLQHKNKEITDSINYAKRIQQAKLPSLSEFKSALNNSFVLFKPKDIVSGDFYYFKQINNLIFLAAADCTGHGVPGAFMSIVCLDKLDSALTQSNNLSQILSITNREIKTSLHQTNHDDSTRDGMDIAICCINLDNNIIQYAGANRPIWIIRNNTLIVEELKSTKTAIGGLTSNEQFFEQHQIQLQKGDTFYIFSDGYADTFNGITDKKLTTKAFRQLLISIQQHPMHTQEVLLNDFLEKWKNNTEQVDDVLIIGIRL